VVLVTPRIVARSSCVSRRTSLIFFILFGVTEPSFACNLQIWLNAHQSGLKISGSLYRKINDESCPFSEGGLDAHHSPMLFSDDEI
jgi:hypothetical protein